MKIKIVLKVIMLAALLTSCYTVIERGKSSRDSEIIYYESFPKETIIDSRLIGNWKATFELIDVGLGTQMLHFDKSGLVHYQFYYSTFRVENLIGQYRSKSDTLYVAFNSTGKIERLAFTFRDKQLFLRNLESPFTDKHNSISDRAERGGFVYE